LSDAATITPLVIKKFAQLPVLFNDRFGCILDLLRDFYALELVLSQPAFQLLRVLFPAGSGTALVVADANSIGILRFLEDTCY